MHLLPTLKQALMCLLLLSAAPHLLAQTSQQNNNGAAPWQKGVHYKVIAQQANPRIGVIEAFSYWCLHCYRFEGIAKEIKANLPRNVRFTKVHVNIMRSVSKQSQDDATKAMLMMRAIKKEEKYNKVMFEAIHQYKKPVGNLQEIRTLFAEEGLDERVFDKLAKSIGLKTHIGLNNTRAEGIKQVPAFVVNDKYQAIYTRDMTPERFAELITWLSKQR